MRNYKNRIIYKISICFILTAFILQSFTFDVYSQNTKEEVFVSLTSSFNPAIVKGVLLDKTDPFKFNFIIHPGDENLSDLEFKRESLKLVKYFLASLTTPEDQMWVNLNPKEKDRIVTDSFGKTQMAQVMLRQDYILKKLTASLMSPEGEVGRSFWERVYKKISNKYGYDIPISSCNRIWIVPKKADIYENENGVFVVNSRLKVLLDKEYLKEFNKVSGEDNNDYAKVTEEVMREILIPEIEKEVNEGKNFSALRQIYNSLILAVWYKRTIKGGVIFNYYVNKNKNRALTVVDDKVKKIYREYLKMFESKAFSFTKEEYDPKVKDVVARQYFSGGITVGTVNNTIKNLKPGQEFKKEISNSINVGFKFSDSAGVVNFGEAKKIKELTPKLEAIVKDSKYVPSAPAKYIKKIMLGKTLHIISTDGLYSADAVRLLKEKIIPEIASLDPKDCVFLTEETLFDDLPETKAFIEMAKVFEITEGASPFITPYNELTYILTNIPQKDLGCMLVNREIEKIKSSRDLDEYEIKELTYSLIKKVSKMLRINNSALRWKYESDKVSALNDSILPKFILDISYSKLLQYFSDKTEKNIVILCNLSYLPIMDNYKSQLNLSEYERNLLMSFYKIANEIRKVSKDQDAFQYDFFYLRKATEKFFENRKKILRDEVVKILEGHFENKDFDDEFKEAVKRWIFYYDEQLLSEDKDYSLGGLYFDVNNMIEQKFSSNMISVEALQNIYSKMKNFISKVYFVDIENANYLAQLIEQENLENFYWVLKETYKLRKEVQEKHSNNQIHELVAIFDKFFRKKSFVEGLYKSRVADMFESGGYSDQIKKKFFVLCEDLYFIIEAYNNERIKLSLFENSSQLDKRKILGSKILEVLKREKIKSVTLENKEKLSLAMKELSEEIPENSKKEALKYFADNVDVYIKILFEIYNKWKEANETIRKLAIDEEILLMSQSKTLLAGTIREYGISDGTKIKLRDWEKDFDSEMYNCKGNYAEFNKYMEKDSKVFSERLKPIFIMIVKDLLAQERGKLITKLRTLYIFLDDLHLTLPSINEMIRLAEEDTASKSGGIDFNYSNLNINSFGGNSKSKVFYKNLFRESLGINVLYPIITSVNSVGNSSEILGY